MTLHRLAALGKILRRPDLAVGETFVGRDWDIAEQDLARLLMALLREDARLEQRATMRLLNAIRHWFEVYFTPNNSERSRRNAAHHFDIGNDLYELFLDPEMQYSCAFYTHDAQNLYEAQRNKLAITLDRLNVAPDMRYLEHWLRLGRYDARDCRTRRICDGYHPRGQTTGAGAGKGAAAS